MMSSLSASGADGQLHLRLIVQVLVPDDLAGLLVGRDDAAVLAGGRDHEIAPQRDAAVAAVVSPGRGPSSTAMRPCGAGAHVDLVDHAPAVDHVHEAVLDQRRHLERLVAARCRRCATANMSFMFLMFDLLIVSSVENALRAVVVMVHQPVVRLGIEQPLEGDVGGVQRGRARQQRAGKRGRGRRWISGSSLSPCPKFDFVSSPHRNVSSEKTGTHGASHDGLWNAWIPVCAGMTARRVTSRTRTSSSRSWPDSSIPANWRSGRSGCA